MNYVRFRAEMRRYPVFTTADVRALDAGFDFRRLYEWQQRGYVRKIVRNCYMFADVDLSEALLMLAANRAYQPSYVSLETALSHYHLIPENVYAITSVSTRRTYAFDTTVGRLSYRTESRRFFFGYRVTEEGARLATMEKAVLDYLHLHPSLVTADDFASLRIDRDAFCEQLDEGRFSTYLDRMARKRLAARAADFREWMRHA